MTIIEKIIACIGALAWIVCSIILLYASISWLVIIACSFTLTDIDWRFTSINILGVLVNIILIGVSLGWYFILQYKGDNPWESI